MTIFNTGYSSFDYESESPLKRLWPIAKMEFLQLFRTKKGLLAFIFCILFVVVKAVAIWWILSSDANQMVQVLEQVWPGLSPVRPEFYINHATGGFGWIPFLVLTCLVSVRSISGDRAVNALEIYWTRGVSPWGYFLAKWVGSFLLLGAAILAGPILLWFYGLLAAPDMTYFDRTIEFMPQVLLALTLNCLIMSFLAVGFSAMSSSPNLAMFLWMLMLGGSKTLGEILNVVDRFRMRRADVVYEPGWYKAICPYEAMDRIQEDMVGLVPGPSDFDQIWIAWVMLGIFAAIVLGVLRRWLRTTEAIA